MLIVALIGAFLLYAVLYFFFEAAQSQLNVNSSILMQVRDMLFSMPEQAPLVFLKFGIIIFAFYVVMDALFSAYRRRRKH